ncbi:MAG: (d)CMP kinase [Planctomycetia bacterium]|nr:(d)CMP kinase [Planctomycetia bacterium]
MIITIDGPAGSGKSTVAARLAGDLHFDYLRTGLMYRVVALAGLRARVDWEKTEELEEIARSISFRFEGSRIFLGDEDVSQEVETAEITAVTKYAAQNPIVRAILTKKQQEFAQGRNCITEGRDQGTEAFPHAELKIYLVAAPEVRAKRRCDQKAALGEPADYDAILKAIVQRDSEDATRACSPMKPAEDALIINSDSMSIEQVVEKIKQALRSKQEIA